MILITGGAGFIGSAFIAHCNQNLRKDIIVSDKLGCENKWKNLLGKSLVDIVDYETLFDQLENEAWAKSITQIVHLGACSSTTERDVDFLLKNNFHYSVTLCQWALARNIRFIYASSGATYGDGSLGYSDADSLTPSLVALNPYGYSKQLFDLWLLNNNLTDKVCGLKFFNVYGPNEYHKESMRSMILKSYLQILESGSIGLFKSYDKRFGDGESKRDFIYIKDCCDVLWWLINNPKVNGIYNLGSGKARSWNDLARAVFGAMKIKPKIEYIEMPLNLRSQYQYFTEAPIEKLLAAGAPAPKTSLEDGVADYVVNYLAKGMSYL